MNPRLSALTIAVGATLVVSSAVAQTTTAPSFFPFPVRQEQQTVPQTPEDWLQRMSDFTQNASAFREPRLFLPWANTITEPSFYTAMARGAIDPAAWLGMANSMANPDAVRNWMWVLDPTVALKWGQAGMDPAFYTSLLTQLSDPGKAMRWAMLPLDPKVWNLVFSMFNPNTYIRWGMAGMDPRMWNLMGNVANPALYTSMLGAVVNPESYGSGVTPWLSWKPPAPVMGASNPWGGEQSASFNMFDPLAVLGNLSLLVPGVNLSTLNLPSLPTLTPMLPTTPPKAPEAPVARPAPAAPAALAVEPAKSAPAPAAETKPAAAAIAAAPEAAKPAPVQAPAKPVAPAKTTLSGDALFKVGKSGIRDLSKDGKKSLDELAESIKALGDVDQIRIVGHADRLGKAAANQKLSERRAASVKSYLVAKGVKPGVIIASGVGDTQPVIVCDDQMPKKKLIECLAPNRRVEIEVTGKP